MRQFPQQSKSRSLLLSQRAFASNMVSRRAWRSLRQFPQQSIFCPLLLSQRAVHSIPILHKYFAEDLLAIAEQQEVSSCARLCLQSAGAHGGVEAISDAIEILSHPTVAKSIPAHQSCTDTPQRIIVATQSSKLQQCETLIGTMLQLTEVLSLLSRRKSCPPQHRSASRHCIWPMRACDVHYIGHRRASTIHMDRP